jgi:hypothetical protein
MILSILGVIYGAFDPSIYAWIDSHHLLTGLGLALMVSESLAATDAVKANSISQATFDLLIGIFKLVLRKKT